jgi:hypothetical protein
MDATRTSSGRESFVLVSFYFKKEHFSKLKAEIKSRMQEQSKGKQLIIV